MSIDIISYPDKIMNRENCAGGFAEDFFREVERVLRELSVDAMPVTLRKRR